MTYTVTKLITNAWYLSGVVARNQQTVTGDQLTDGLDLLNDLLGVKTADYRLIPYFSATTVNAVIGQEKYFVPNLISLETITFNQQTVRYSMLKQGRKKYFGTGRIDGINSLPFDVHWERTLGGSNFYVYFFPVETYVFNLFGKFGLTSVGVNDDLLQVYDRYYIVYLRYALAEYMASDYNITLQPQVEMKLHQLENMITDISPIDLTVSKLSSFQGDGGLNWADVNVGRGWRP